MADELEAITDQAFDIFKGALKGFVEDEAVDAFAKERIKQYAQESFYALKASSDAEKAEHEANLKHLVAQARGEARQLQIAISTEAKEAVGSVLEVVGNMFLKVAPKLIAALAL